VSEAPVATREVPCPLCGGAGAERLFTAVDRLHGTPGAYDYVRCDRCGLVYMNPQVDGDLSPLYPEEYEPHRVPSDLGSPSRTARLLRGVPVLGTLVREALSATMIDDWVAAQLSPESRWLDVGCGSGAFLRKVRDRIGCEVTGVDIAPAAVRVARAAGLEIHLGTVEDAPFPPRRFDVVSGWWYLEHVPNPVEVLGRLAVLLAEGGLCILAVPNTASLNARIFGARWYHLDCPRHLTLWSPATTRRLIEDRGLAVERIRFDKSAWGLAGSLRHAGIPLPRALDPMLLPLTVAAGVVRLSDTIVVFGRKARR
jgi:SAM-dependent methyltransferase